MNRSQKFLGITEILANGSTRKRSVILQCSRIIKLLKENGMYAKCFG